MAEEEKRRAEGPGSDPDKLNEEEFMIRDAEDDGSGSPFANGIGIIDSPESIHLQLQNLGIAGNRYSLDSIDDAAKEFLECCMYSRIDPDDESLVDIVINRAD